MVEPPKDPPAIRFCEAQGHHAVSRVLVPVIRAGETCAPTRDMHRADARMIR